MSKHYFLPFLPSFHLPFTLIIFLLCAVIHLYTYLLKCLFDHLSIYYVKPFLVLSTNVIVHFSSLLFLFILLYFLLLLYYTLSPQRHFLLFIIFFILHLFLSLHCVSFLIPAYSFFLVLLPLFCTLLLFCFFFFFTSTILSLSVLYSVIACLHSFYLLIYLLSVLI